MEAADERKRKKARDRGVLRVRLRFQKARLDSRQREKPSLASTRRRKGNRGGGKSEHTLMGNYYARSIPLKNSW